MTKKQNKIEDSNDFVSVLERIFKKYSFKQLDDFLMKIIPSIIGDIEITEKNMSSFWINLHMKLKNNVNLRVVINERENLNWITFYFEKDLLDIEQVDFMIIDNAESMFNRIIKHDYFIVENDIATTFNSGYSFINEVYQSGWEQIRGVYFKEIQHYAGKDNLANFACNIDSSKNEILYKENIEPVKEEPIIEPVYLQQKGVRRILINK